MNFATPSNIFLLTELIPIEQSLSDIKDKFTANGFKLLETNDSKIRLRGTNLFEMIFSGVHITTTISEVEIEKIDQHFQVTVSYKNLFLFLVLIDVLFMFIRVNSNSSYLGEKTLSVLLINSVLILVLEINKLLTKMRLIHLLKK